MILCLVVPVLVLVRMFLVAVGCEVVNLVCLLWVVACWVCFTFAGVLWLHFELFWF